MPIEISWDTHDSAVLHIALVGRWTWQEYFAQRDTLNQYLGGAAAPVYVLIDLRASKDIPTNGLTEMARSTQRALRHPQWKGSVFVGSHPLVRLLVNTFLRLNPSMRERFVLADTLEEARAQIQRWKEQHVA